VKTKLTTIKVNDNLFLNELSFKLPKEEKTIHSPEPKHQYIIIDRSGSMYGDLKELISVLKNYVQELPENSTVSLGYFSGRDEYSLSVPYVLKKEVDGSIKMLDSFTTALGLTNFIEILNKVKADLETRQAKASLYFFTDGYHNSGGNYNEVKEVLDKLKQYLEVSVFVGCGYINRENMLDMANTVEGTFVHLKDFKEVKSSLYNFKDSVDDLSPSLELPVPSGATYIASILGKNIMNYSKDTNNLVKLKTSVKQKQSICFITDNVLEPSNIVEVNKSHEQMVRALSLSLIQKNETNKALQVLDLIGEKYFIRKLFSTYTPDEYAEIESEIHNSIFSSKGRYLEGVVKNYLPDPNAQCVLDVLNVLAEDEKTLVHLDDVDFKYQRIGRKQIQTDGSNIIYPKDNSASASAITFHEERLNVSLSVNYGAEVPLVIDSFKNKPFTKEDLSSFSLQEGHKHPITVFKNYSIIADGKLQTEQLVISNLSKASISKLGELLTVKKVNNKNRYVLSLKSLPLINTSYLKTTSAEVLANSYWNQLVLSYAASVLKFLIKGHKEACITTNTLTQDTELTEFLAEHCYIKEGSYSPPRIQEEPTDVYSAYEFKVGIKGFSKCSVPSVVRKIIDSKKITIREQIVAYFYNAYNNLPIQNLETLLKEQHKELNNVRKQIQQAKFAILLVNRGKMDEFDNREDMKVTLKPTSFVSFDEIKEITVEFQINKVDISI